LKNGKSRLDRENSSEKITVLEGAIMKSLHRRLQPKPFSSAIRLNCMKPARPLARRCSFAWGGFAPSFHAPMQQEKRTAVANATEASGAPCTNGAMGSF
jgi:hypothetical protein